MSFCVRCGRGVPGGGSFCPGCGAPVPADPSAPRGAPPPPADPAAPVSAAEWRAYVGPNADAYLARFSAFTVGNVDAFAVTWNWPVFLCFCFPFLWFLYRRLHLAALLSFLLWSVPGLNLLAWIAVPMAANYVYFTEGKKRILALRAANGGTVPPATLAAAGGVNRWVVVVAAALAVLAALALLASLLLVRELGELRHAAGGRSV